MSRPPDLPPRAEAVVPVRHAAAGGGVQGGGVVDATGVGGVGLDLPGAVQVVEERVQLVNVLLEAGGLDVGASNRAVVVLRRVSGVAVLL